MMSCPHMFLISFEGISFPHSTYPMTIPARW